MTVSSVSAPPNFKQSGPRTLNNYSIIDPRLKFKTTCDFKQICFL